MRFKYMSTKLVFLLVLLLSTGCAGFGDDRGQTDFDLSRINQDIERANPGEIVPDDGNEESSAPAEEKIKIVPVRDINLGKSTTNPYLAKISENRQPPEEEKQAPGEGVLLNFDNADIYEVIQVIAEILDISYIIDPQVKGVVNIRSGKQIPMGQLAAVFRKLLNINGLDIRSEGEYNYIYMTKKPGSRLIFGPEAIGTLKDSPKFIIQIIPVMYLSAAEAKKLLEPYTSDQGLIEILEDANTLFITDYESKVVDIMMIMASLDVSPLASLKVRLVRVDKSPLFDLRDELNNILGALHINKGSHDGVTVLALERANSLLLVSNNQEMLDSATRWISELDVAPTEGRDNIYIYNVRNSVASELAALVSDLIGSQTKITAKTDFAPDDKAKSSAGTSTNQATVPAAPAVTKVGKAASGKVEAGVGLRWAGEPSLIADDSRNVILLRALPADYSRLVKLLEKLDNMPRQVLIEVMVAEVALSDRWELGIEWSLSKQGVLDGRAYKNHLTSNLSSIANGNTTDGPITHDNLINTAAGLTASVLHTTGEVAGILNAIADDNELSILSSPQVMVLNNETATVNVGQQVPIVTSQTGDINSSNLNQTIQYKDTGVILKVTPKINYDGIIILEINQQVSSASENTLGGNSSPVISNRELNTKLAVRDGQTIFMGGLIENKSTIIDSGVPLLKDIPLLGWLFKYQKEEKKKTELLVMITPYVIESENVLGQYVESFNGKMQELRDKLRK